MGAGVKLLGGWLLTVLFAAAACTEKLPERTIAVHGTPLTLEIAVSQAARHCGLSGRTSLPPDRGMLFVLPCSMPVAFWMSETALHLSIAFLDEQGRIVSIQAMTPGRTDLLYASPGPVSYAVEVNAGWFEGHGVKVGDVITLPVQTEAR